MGSVVDIDYYYQSRMSAMFFRTSIPIPRLLLCLLYLIVCLVAIVGNFNKEKALVGYFSGHCETSRRFVDSSRILIAFNQINSGQPSSSSSGGVGISQCYGGPGQSRREAAAEAGEDLEGGQAASSWPEDGGSSGHTLGSSVTCAAAGGRAV